MMGFSLQFAGVLAVLSCLFTKGDSLKCSVYACQGTTADKLTCKDLTPETCPADHSCRFQRLGLRTNGTTLYVETGVCSPKTVCAMDFCKLSNITGALLDCGQSCCEQDFCNARKSKPQPTSEAPIAGGVTCYNCDSMTINGKLNKTTCDKPKKVKCSANQDRCIRVKMTLVNEVGKIIPEYRGCANEKYCNNVCRNANETEGGKFTTCDKRCCFGDLCNTEQEPSTGNCVTYHCFVLFIVVALSFLMLSS